jgi:kelch-like protein 19
MNSPRSALACVTLCSKVFAIGGYNGSNFLSSTEVYDPATEVWTITPFLLSSERSGHGAAVTVETKFK